MADYTYVGSGGISVSGPRHYILNAGYVPDSGVVVGGSAVYHTSLPSYAYVMIGGVKISGPDYNIQDFSYCMTGGVRIGGSDVAHSVVHYVYMATGGVRIRGQASQLSANYSYAMSGGVHIGGHATVDTEIHLDILIGWNTLANIAVDIQIGWNTGSTPLFYFRVEGECLPLACPLEDTSITDKACSAGSSYYSIQNIVAQDVCDVCAQLQARRLIRYIKNIKKFSRPAREVDILAFEAKGIPQDCNTLVNVDFCQCVQCHIFCDPDTQETRLIKKGLIEPPIVNAPHTRDFAYRGNGRFLVRGEAIVSWKPNEIPITPDTSTILTNCGCSVPSTIYLTHGLEIGAKIKDFLARNGNTLPSTLPLYYSKVQQKWLTSVGFEGMSVDGIHQERWSVILEMECSHEVDGTTDEGNPSYWRAAATVRQQNLANNTSLNTRLQVGFLREGPCVRGELNIRTYVDTKTLKATTDSVGLVTDVKLEDKIGLFKSDYWLRHPKLRFDINIYDRSKALKHHLYGHIYPQLEISMVN